MAFGLATQSQQHVTKQNKVLLQFKHAGLEGLQGRG